MGKTKFLVPIAIVWMTLVSSSAQALGEDGHEAVCYIAYAQASPQTREKIDTLISLDPEYSQIEDPAEAFARSCVWADTVKPARWQEHFVNVPRNTKKIKSLDCPEADKCLLSAIVDDIGVLKDPAATAEDKLKALKYMGHWIGDLHQPLHVSFKSDKGGNDVKISGFDRCKNLHAMWDTCLVVHLMTENDLATARDLASYLPLPDPDSSWKPYQGLETIPRWASASYGVATAQSGFYCWWKGGECLPIAEAMPGLVNPDTGLEPAADWMNSFSKTLSLLMGRGGMALAGMLDDELVLSDG